MSALDGFVPISPECVCSARMCICVRVGWPGRSRAAGRIITSRRLASILSGAAGPSLLVAQSSELLNRSTDPAIRSKRKTSDIKVIRQKSVCPARAP